MKAKKMFRKMTKKNFNFNPSKSPILKCEFWRENTKYIFFAIFKHCEEVKAVRIALWF